MLREFEKVYVKIPEKKFFLEGIYLFNYKHDKDYYFILYNNNDEWFISVINKKYILNYSGKFLFIEKKEGLNLNCYIFSKKTLKDLLYIYSASQYISFLLYKLEPTKKEKIKYFFKKIIKQLAF